METTGMAKRTLYWYLPMLVRVGAVMVSGRIERAELYDLNSVSPVVRCFMMLEEELTGTEV